MAISFIRAAAASSSRAAAHVGRRSLCRSSLLSSPTTSSSSGVRRQNVGQLTIQTLAQVQQLTASTSSRPRRTQQPTAFGRSAPLSRARVGRSWAVAAGPWSCRTWSSSSSSPARSIAGPNTASAGAAFLQEVRRLTGMWRTTSGQPYSFEPLLLPFYRTVYLYENQVPDGSVTVLAADVCAGAPAGLEHIFVGLRQICNPLPLASLVLQQHPHLSRPAPAHAMDMPGHAFDPAIDSKHLGLDWQVVPFSMGPPTTGLLQNHSQLRLLERFAFPVYSYAGFISPERDRDSPWSLCTVQDGYFTDSVRSWRYNYRWELDEQIPGSFTKAIEISASGIRRSPVAREVFYPTARDKLDWSSSILRSPVRPSGDRIEVMHRICEVFEQKQEEHLRRKEDTAKQMAADALIREAARKARKAAQDAQVEEAAKKEALASNKRAAEAKANHKRQNDLTKKAHEAVRQSRAKARAQKTPPPPRAEERSEPPPLSSPAQTARPHAPAPFVLHDPDGLYAALGLKPRGATKVPSDDAIRNARNEQVLRWHPDRPGGDHERMQRVNGAFSRLESEELRILYQSSRGRQG